jgi:alpha-L-arabinofuranosidase
MTEEINYSYDGGLYAEMVRNRTFRSDWSGMLYWYLVENGNAAGKDGGRQDRPAPAKLCLLACASTWSRPTAQPGRRAERGLVGHGALRPETTYKGSFYAKAGSSDLGPVTVSLVSDDTGKAVATPLFPPSARMEAVRIHAQDRRAQPSANNHLVHHRRPHRNSLAESCLALPAHLSRSRRTATAST